MKQEEIFGIVYACLNMNTGKVYIGKTIKHLKYRWREHQADINRGSQSRFHNSIRKHGIENFCIWAVEKDIPEELLIEREQYYIDLWNTLVPYGYNLKEAGSRGKASEETKKKMSDSKMGEKNSFMERNIPRNLGPRCLKLELVKVIRFMVRRIHTNLIEREEKL